MEFETKIRSPRKLPKGMVFPVSSKTLQENLADVPQKGEVLVNYFSMANSASATKMSGKQYLVLSAQLTRPAMSLSRPNILVESTKHDSWRISVSAVPQSDLTVIREGLQNEGFARITKWFIESQKHAGVVGTHSIQVSFDGKKLQYECLDSLS